MAGKIVAVFFEENSNSYASKIFLAPLTTPLLPRNLLNSFPEQTPKFALPSEKKMEGPKIFNLLTAGKISSINPCNDSHLRFWRSFSFYKKSNFRIFELRVNPRVFVQAQGFITTSRLIVLD